MYSELVSMTDETDYVAVEPNLDGRTRAVLDVEFMDGDFINTVRVGQTVFLFARLKFTPRIEALLENNHPVSLCLPTSLEYVARRNRLSRQDVYLWLARLNRRWLRRHKPILDAEIEVLAPKETSNPEPLEAAS